MVGKSLGSIESQARSLYAQHATDHGEGHRIPIKVGGGTFAAKYTDIFGVLGVGIEKPEKKDDYAEYEEKNEESFPEELLKLDYLLHKNPIPDQKSLPFDNTEYNEHEPESLLPPDVIKNPYNRMITIGNLALTRSANTPSELHVIQANVHYQENRQVYMAMALAEAADQDIEVKPDPAFL